MIIISQEKESIVNFDNIVYIDIDDDNIIVAETDGACADLGQYKTKERAKEVLQLILKFYSRMDLESEQPVDKAIAITLMRDKAVFQMPEE